MASHNKMFAALPISTNICLMVHLLISRETTSGESLVVFNSVLLGPGGGIVQYVNDVGGTILSLCYSLCSAM